MAVVETAERRTIIPEKRGVCIVGTKYVWGRIEIGRVLLFLRPLGSLMGY